MKRLVFGLTFIALGFFTINHFSRMENDVDDELTQKITKGYEQDVLDNKVRDLVNKSKSISDLEIAEDMMQSLPPKDRDRIAATIALKKSAIWFNEAEEYLRKAVEIERAAGDINPLPSPVPNPLNPAEQIQPPQKAFHPLTVANLEKAFALYEKARKECEKLKDGNDSDFNYHINYLKGEIYYRILELMADQESVQEIFNQTLTYYKYALRNRANDINTIVNIEILIKNQSGLVGNAGNPQARKKQMLNSKKYGVGKTTGN